MKSRRSNRNTPATIAKPAAISGASAAMTLVYASQKLVTHTASHAVSAIGTAV